MTEEAKGIVSEIKFTNEDNGYTVCEITGADGDEFTAVGNMPGISPGENVHLTGEWVVHSSYGPQFKVDSYETVIPQTEVQILMYLSAGIVKGIGPSTAKKIVDKFGTKSLDVLRDEPLLLSTIKGISDAKALQMNESFLSKTVMQSLVMFLQPFGVTPAFAVKVFKALGGSAVSKIKENPYSLCEIEGIGFKTADKIASKMGFDPFDNTRLEQGVLFTMRELILSGSTYSDYETIVSAAAHMLSCDSEAAESALMRLIASGRITREYIDDKTALYLPAYYNAELGTARKMAALCAIPVRGSREKTEQIIYSVEKTSNIILSAEQKRACILACTNNVFIITGGPGTGKTTIIKTIISVMEHGGKTVALCAPTGRAAKRMTETCGLEAKTIHRLLEFNFAEGENQSFERCESFPIDEDVVIVDEMSMVDTLLMYALVRALKPGAQLIMSGDADQLPSVGAGNVLRDMIDSGKIPMIRLNEIYRQASESMIIVNAHRINSGEEPVLNLKNKDFFFIDRPDTESILSTVSDLCSVRLPKAYGYNPMSDIQVISPSRKTTLGVSELNRVLQEKLNPASPEKDEHESGKTLYRTGDKVMQIKNNYSITWKDIKTGKSGEGIFNGDIGIIEEINSKERYVKIIFDEDKQTKYEFSQLEEIELAYSVTVHKSQGNEFPAVIMPMYHSSTMLMSRNLLYTALTRAKELVVLVGQREVMYKMIQNNRENDRRCGLCKKLKDLIY